MSKTNQVLIAIWLVIASFIAYLIADLMNSRQLVEQRVGDQAKSYVRMVEQHASASFDRARIGIMGVADHVRASDLTGAKPLDPARRAELDALLRTQQQRTPGVIAMPLANADGEIIAHSLTAPPGVNLSDREYFQALKQQPHTDITVSAVVHGRVSNKPGVQIVRRIDLPDGAFGGTIGANLGLAENFSDFYASLALGKDSAVSLRDANNKLLVRFPVVEEKLGKQIPSASAIKERMLAGDAEGLVVVASAIDNIERAFAFRRLPRYPVYAAVGLSLDEALSGWRVERKNVALGTALIVLAGIFITVMLRRKERAEILSLRLARIVESTNAAIIAADLQGMITSWNAGAQKLFGYSAEEVMGKPALLLVPPEKREEHQALVARSASGEGTANLETVRLARDGQRVDVALAISSIRDSRANPVGYSVIARDITDRKEVEEELLQSIAFSELLSEAMPLPVFHKDNSGRYTGCNSAFARFIGKDKSEIVGKTVFDVSPQSLAKTYKDKDLDLLSDPVGMQTYESRVAQADGSVRDVIFHKARITDHTGKPTGIVGIITDITELRQIQARQDQLEAQLRQAQKMEALGTLAGGVAHDFNNIIATIMGNAELARQDVSPGHPAQQSLEEIAKASRRAKDLVQQILAFSRRQNTTREAIALAPVVEESVRLLRTTLPAGVSLTLECAPDTPAVLADSTQVEQVLLNLCSNAWQAMRGQARSGLIEVSLRAHERAAGQAQESGIALASGEMRPGCYACLTVRDNGSGMDPATLARIFEPFFTTKPVDEGTGLGLAVVHGIVQAHGASIEVQSVPGTGSIFRVYFPAVQACAQVDSTHTPPPAPLHGQGKRVLYIDDDESIVLLMTRMLERQGYRVSGYTDPEEALAAARADPGQFDLAVTDFNMPDMSGLEVARALRKIRADLPVAVASGYITEELRQEAPAAGVSELIYKPNTVADLCKAVARLVAAQGRNGLS